jgi:outer membrane cobalamin receptor
LAAYTLTEVTTGVRYNLSKYTVESAFRVENILDVQYQTIAWRAMPGRSFHLSITFNYN